MHLTPVQIQLLHVLFCFAQADRPADSRLVARLVLLSQRSLVEEIRVLRRRGWVEPGTLRLTPSGLAYAGRLRTGTDVNDWSEAA